MLDTLRNPCILGARQAQSGPAIKPSPTGETVMTSKAERKEARLDEQERQQIAGGGLVKLCEIRKEALFTTSSYTYYTELLEYTTDLDRSRGCSIRKINAATQAAWDAREYMSYDEYPRHQETIDDDRLTQIRIFWRQIIKDRKADGIRWGDINPDMSRLIPDDTY